MSHDLLLVFVPEARELLDWLGVGLLEFERGPATRATRDRLGRHAHTLKGTARIVGQEAIAGAAHAFEDLLAHVEPGALVRPADLDGMRALLAACDRALAEATRPARESTADVPETAHFSSVRVPLATLDALLASLDELTFRHERLRELTAAAAGAGHAGEIHEGLDFAARELAEARDLVARSRMIPAAELFTALELVAQDAAAAVAKRVDFVASGGDVALEGHVLAQLREALSHVVRNAVDHGIEAGHERVAGGKAPTGRVTLDVRRHGHRATFTCRDDGRGIDAAAVIKRAVERGLVDPATATPEGGEAWSLIFDAGMTTRDAISEISGRGVGLAVVRTIVDRLGGVVSVESQPAWGTALTIDVPLARASLDVLLAGAGAAVVAFPLDAVVGVVGVGGAVLTPAADGEVLWSGERTLPYFPVGPAFGGDASDAVAAYVVVRADRDEVAVGVSSLGGVAVLSSAPVPPLAGPQPLLAGVATGALGVPTPVLDPQGLVMAARRPRPATLPSPVRPMPAILAIDDSLTTRTLLDRILGAAGYEVVLAAGVQEGLAMARQRPFALFIVDGEMPDLDGFAFLAQARADARLSAVPTIMLTSLDAAEHRERALAAGARAYVNKAEFAHAGFLATVRELAV